MCKTYVTVAMSNIKYAGNVYAIPETLISHRFGNSYYDDCILYDTIYG